MTKVLHCSDLMPGCSWEGHGDSETEVLMPAAEHAKMAHNLTEISPELLAAVRGAIHDEDQSKAQSASS